jgi:hypothetical protein
MSIDRYVLLCNARVMLSGAGVAFCIGRRDSSARNVLFRARGRDTPHPMPATSAAGLLVLAQFALGCTQKSLAELLGVSARTMMRWQSGRTTATRLVMTQLAPLVYPRDAALAAQLATAGGTTLEALGIVAPAPPPAPAAPARPAPTTRHLLDAVVCAAGDAVDVPVRALRPALFAAFVRAKDLGLGVDDLVAGLGEAKKSARAAKA